ncbi:hypothetical protein ACN47E_002849 [Coniothyrium glycines]
MWVLSGVCILLTAGRYMIRWKVSLRLQKDDVAHLFALVWLIIFCAVTQALFEPTKIMLQSLEIPGAETPLDTISEFCRLQTAQGATFYLLHWTVKLAFLLFYRDLFWVSRNFIRAWWTVATFVLVGLVVALAGILTQRGPINRMDDPTVCAQHNNYQQVARIYICVANVSTDLAVMILPMPILRRLRIRKTQKLGLVLVFSVCLLTIALELFRFLRNITGDDTTNNILYAVINANLTIVISCTPAYRSLWTLWQNSKRLAERASLGSARPRQSTQKLPQVGAEHMQATDAHRAGCQVSVLGRGRDESFGRVPPPRTAERPPSYRSVI